MTMLASWVGVDTHGQSSAYIVSESRISWHDEQNHKDYYYDFGKKVFAAKNYPDIFGYAGDVLFPSIALAQIVEMIDAGVFFTPEMSRDEKHGKVYEKICHAFSVYPRECSNKIVKILHISRDSFSGKYPSFSAKVYQWTSRKGWEMVNCDMPEESGLLFVLGNKEEFMSNYARYQTGPNKDTSRNVFHCFMDTLFNTQRKDCGGAPQLVGIYRKPNSPAINFGIIYNKRRYFLGSELTKDAVYDNIKWRNELFELTNGSTKKRIDSAAEQPDPLRRH